MQSIPIDTAQLGGVLCVRVPEPRVNRETGEVRTNRDGEPLFVIAVALLQAERRGADVVDVVIPGEPPRIPEGARVRLTELVQRAWEMEGRSGVSYRAASVAVEPGPGAPPSSAPPGSSSSSSPSSASSARGKGGESA